MRKLRNISPIWIALGSVWVAVVIIFAVIVFVSKDVAEEQARSSPAPSAATQLSAVEKAENWAEPSIAVSERGDTYTAFSENPKEPKILEVAIDPLHDVEEGEDQVITVKLREKGDSITRDNTVTVEMITDAGSEMVFLELKKVEEPDLSTTWSGVWTFEAPHTELLQAKITAANASDMNWVTLSFK